MSEVCDGAMFLITASYQALQRIEHPGQAIQFDRSTLPCDELVTVVFLGFYLEASLTFIIQKLGETEEMVKFFYPKKKPKNPNIGLRRKFAWFYNKYVARSVAPNWNALRRSNNKIDAKLERKFPGFTKINAFRNDIAHGDLDKAIKRIIKEYKDPKAVDLLRTQAKVIVDTLIKIAHKAHFNDIGKNVSYEDVLNN